MNHILCIFLSYSEKCRHCSKLPFSMYKQGVYITTSHYLLVSSFFFFVRFFCICLYENIFQESFVIYLNKANTSNLFLLRWGCSSDRHISHNLFSFPGPQDYCATWGERAKLVHLPNLDITVVIMFQFSVIYLHKCHSHKWFSSSKCWLKGVSRGLPVQPPTQTGAHSQHQLALPCLAKS